MHVGLVCIESTGKIGNVTSTLVLQNSTLEARLK